MIVTQHVVIKITNSNIKYYKSKGYSVKSGDVINIKYEELPKNSNIQIKIKCDICEVEKNSTNNAYNRYISSSPDSKYRCKKCNSTLRLNTMMLKYNSYTNTDKYKKTLEEKYGGHFNKLDKFKDKIKKTNIVKYGVEYATSSDMIKNKIKQTNINKYGVDNYISSDDFRKKIVNKYGVDNVMRNDDIKLKHQKKCLEKYGFENISSSDDIKNKKIETSIKRYEVDFIFKSEKFRKENYKIANHVNYINYVDNCQSKFKCDCGETHEFIINTNNYFQRVESNLPLCTICYPIGELISIKEEEIFNYIKSIYSGEIIQSYRDGLEIDIYLPELKIGFEFNGLYWHSNLFKDKNYHLNKTNYFKERGIRIIHIWEDDWSNKTDIIKSQISNLIGKSVKIFARKCVIKEISDVKLLKEFLNKNHIQGWVNSKVMLGMFYQGSLVSLMTFDQFEGRKKMSENDWNLNRFCSKLNTSVIGGPSKLLKFFIRKYNPNRIISYADKSWSVGNLYIMLGFKPINEIKPDYKYIVNNLRINKSRYRKSYTGISESKLQINKIYDCGKIKFEKI